jgi:DnaJ-class molecular chaperone
MVLSGYAGTVPAGTKILRFGTGTGGNGTYILSAGGDITSQAMIGTNANNYSHRNDATYNINWEQILPTEYDAYKVAFSFGTSGGQYSDDTANNRIGINTTDPSYSIHIAYNTSNTIYNGISKNIKFNVKNYCKKCNCICEKCNGTGMIQQLIQMGPMTQILQSNCHFCSSSGFSIKNNKDCQQCKGSGVYETEHMAHLNMPKGFTDKTTIFAGLGEQPKTAKQKAGNIVVEFNLLPHKHFHKKDNDLYYKQTITLTESILGKLITIPYFEEEIKININQFGIINPNKQYMLKNRGLPILNSSKKGNMVIEFNIKYPTKLTDNKDDLNSFTNMLDKTFIY